MEALCLSVFNCETEISALLKRTEGSYSFNKHVLITRCAPGAVPAAYNSESAGHRENLPAPWSLQSVGKADNC